MGKTFSEKQKELYELNLNDYTEDKNGFTYLQWQRAWSEFLKKFPHGTFKLLKDSKGKCYFGDPNIGYTVYTEVRAEPNGVVREMFLTVTDGANRCLKPYEYEVETRQGIKTVKAITMRNITDASIRCLVKNLALFGVGAYIYSGDSEPVDAENFEIENDVENFEPIPEQTFEGQEDVESEDDRQARIETEEREIAEKEEIEEQRRVEAGGVTEETMGELVDLLEGTNFTLEMLLSKYSVEAWYELQQEVVLKAIEKLSPSTEEEEK